MKHITINLQHLIEKVEVTTCPCCGCNQPNEHLEKQYLEIEQRVKEALLRSIEMCVKHAPTAHQAKGDQPEGCC